MGARDRHRVVSEDERRAYGRGSAAGSWKQVPGRLFHLEGVCRGSDEERGVSKTVTKKAARKTTKKASPAKKKAATKASTGAKSASRKAATKKKTAAKKKTPAKKSGGGKSPPRKTANKKKTSSRKSGGGKSPPRKTANKKKTPAKRKTANKKKTAAKKKTGASKRVVPKSAGAEKAARTAKKTASKASAKRAPAPKKAASKKTRATKRPPRKTSKKAPAVRTRTRKSSAMAGRSAIRHPSARERRSASRSAELAPAPAQASKSVASAGTTKPRAAILPKLTRRQLEKLRAQLRGKLSQISNHMESELTELEIPDKGRGRDIEDLATDADGTDSLCEIMDVEASQIDQIRSALKKIDEGTYGVCEDCGDAIGPARLEALPFATQCIECKRKSERTSASSVAFFSSFS